MMSKELKNYCSQPRYLICLSQAKGQFSSAGMKNMEQVFQGNTKYFPPQKNNSLKLKKEHHNSKTYSLRNLFDELTKMILPIFLKLYVFQEIFQYLPLKFVGNILCFRDKEDFILWTGIKNFESVFWRFPKKINFLENDPQKRFLWAECKVQDLYAGNKRAFVSLRNLLLRKFLPSS